MKAKLEVIREILGTQLQETQRELSKPNGFFTRWYPNPAYARLEQATRFADSLIAELDSAELLEKIAESIVLSTGYSSDSPGFGACVNGAKREAQAAINAITEDR